MLRVSVLYPKQAGGRFDFDYYLKTHIPLAKKLVGDALKRVEVYKGVGGPGGAPEAYVCSASLFFDSAQAFEKAFGPVADKVMADVSNYTNLQPVVQLEDQVL
jgi:uncharacterized protein (TIGR02118 family)